MENNAKSNLMNPHFIEHFAASVSCLRMYSDEMTKLEGELIQKNERLAYLKTEIDKTSTNILGMLEK